MRMSAGKILSSVYICWDRKIQIFKILSGTSLVVRWLRLCAPNAGGPGSIPGLGTRPHVPRLRAHRLQLRELNAATQTWPSQIVR